MGSISMGSENTVLVAEAFLETQMLWLLLIHVLIQLAVESRDCYLKKKK